MSYKAVIFDLDGTLVDSVEDLGSSVNRVLKLNRFPAHDLKDYYMMIGDGAEMMIKRALPPHYRDEETVKRCLEQFLEDYSINYKQKTVPFDGIPELLDSLQQRSIRLAVLTNKPCEISRKLVSEVLSKWKFEFVLGHKDGFPRKPDPSGAFFIAKKLNMSPEEIVYVGDSGVDMQTASSAGMLAVGVLWGLRDREELEKSGADYIIKKPSELLDLVEFSAE